MSAPPLERAREAMAAAGVDAVLAASPGTVAFLTGHVVEAQIALPSRDSRLEKPTLALVTADDAVTIGFDPRPLMGEAIAYGDDAVGQREAPRAFGALGAALDGLGLRSGTVAVEGAYVPASGFRLAAERAPALSWQPLDDLLRSARAAKDQWEVESVRAACELADAAQDAVRAAVRPGVSEAELYAAAVAGVCGRAQDHAIAGGEVVAGARTEAGMGRAGAYRVRAGDLVMSDLFPRHANGFWADSCMTVSCGSPTPQDRADARRLRDAIEAGRDRLRPGVTAHEVYEAVAAVAGALPVHAGHGIGRDHYEDPVLVPGNRERLQDGATVVLEPGVYRPGRGMRLEWAFQVTPDGGEPLTRFSLDIDQQEQT